MEKKFYKEIEKQMNVGTLKEFEKELRVKIHEELEKEREKISGLNEYLYHHETDLFGKIERNSDMIFSQSGTKMSDRLKHLINLYVETSNLYVRVKGVNKQVKKIKQLIL